VKIDSDDLIYWYIFTTVRTVLKLYLAINQLANQ